MAIYYRDGRNLKKWVKLPDYTPNLKSWTEYKLKEEAYCDNDNGYSHYLEIDNDDVRTYAFMSFENYYSEDLQEDVYGAPSVFEYGSIEDMKKVNESGWYPKIVRSEYSPRRDWILL